MSKNTKQNDEISQDDRNEAIYAATNYLVGTSIVERVDEDSGKVFNVQDQYEVKAADDSKNDHGSFGGPNHGNYLHTSPG